MKTYLVKDINKQFTDVISNYIKDGYSIHTNTMGGSQGEKASIHLMAPDRKSVLRISLDSFSDWHNSTDGYEINIRKYDTSKLRQINDLSSMNDILWENSGELVDNQKFYQISNIKKNFYGDLEAYTKASKLHAERYKKNDHIFDHTVYTKNITSPKVIKTIMPWIRRQYKCTSTLPRDVESVSKCLEYSNGANGLEARPCYKVELKNKTLILKHKR